MAKKPAPAAAPTSGMPDLSALSSHQIWLAGLGAMAQAQAQGSKAIETLVSDGLAFQRKSQEEARQRFEEATERFASMAQGLGQQTAGRIDKLEHVFEERVARALHRLGMPTLQDIADLQARVADLEAQLAKAGKPAAKSAKMPARKTPRKG
jgi:poly(hydroxyalkanoate) granule-associated protein